MDATEWVLPGRAADTDTWPAGLYRGRPTRLAERHRVLCARENSVGDGPAFGHDAEVELQAPRVMVRDLAFDDLDAMVEAWTAADIPGFMDDFGPRTPEEVEGWLPDAIAARDSDPRCGACAIVERSSEEVVGWIGWGGSGERHRHIGDIDFAYLVAPRFRGRGYASEALTEVVDYCLSELGVGSVWGRCHPDNPASRRVMENAGLRPIGDVEGEPAFRVDRTEWSRPDRRPRTG